MNATSPAPCRRSAATAFMPITLLVSAAVLAGCATPAADQALRGQAELVGMTKETLLSCAGVPERQAAAGGQEFYTYRSGRLISRPAPPMWGPWGYPYWGHPGWGYGGWDWPHNEVESVDCEATFSLRGGVVERVVYGGASRGSRQLGQCYAIIQNCISPFEQSRTGMSQRMTR